MRNAIAVMTLGLLLGNAAVARGAPPDAPTPPVAPTPSAVGSGVAGGPTYDPCAVVSKDDVASASGVAVDQVYAPTSPTRDECVWAVAAHGGMPAQRVAFTMQTVEQVKASHGMARFGALLSAIGNIPGVTLPAIPMVTRAFADAQVVVGLGDRAGWKNGTLSVLKSETLYEITSTGQPTDSESLRVSRAIAQSALNHTDVTGAATPKPAQ